MIESGKLNGYLVDIKKELRHAESKHPKFCDCYDSFIHAGDKTEITEVLTYIQSRNDQLAKTNKIGAINILHEEVLEATMAYLEGDLPHCLQELAQCGAVILRTMEFVKNEMEKENEVR